MKKMTPVEALGFHYAWAGRKRDPMVARGLLLAILSDAEPGTASIEICDDSEPDEKEADSAWRLRTKASVVCTNRVARKLSSTSLVLRVTIVKQIAHRGL